MPVEASSGPRLEHSVREGWWWSRWASRRVITGITDRHGDAALLAASLAGPITMVAAEQVHGSSLAVIERHDPTPLVIPGCDALLTSVSRAALLVRSADCLPVFFTDASRGVVGIAHAGWRGLAAHLLTRTIAMFRHVYHSRPDDLRVAIGPSIRSCCYEVGPEFAERFGAFVRLQNGRRTCDLIGVAVDQLTRCGICPTRIVDSEHCTACEAEHWYSLRREGQAAGRMTSLIMLRS